ncbi:MAG: hypothetical protein J7L15_00945 [Clostridiales bacterium]|nr:hypothetical protein [Clostridiales bacterium]
MNEFDEQMNKDKTQQMPTLHEKWVELKEDKETQGVYDAYELAGIKNGLTWEDIYICQKRLVRFEGRYWFLEMITDHTACLVDITDDSKGNSAPLDKVREIKGNEFLRQMDGIVYFKNKENK